jgi:hypothetical protein
VLAKIILQGFIVKPDEANPHKFSVYEEFVDQTAFDNHQARVKSSKWDEVTINVLQVIKAGQKTVGFYSFVAYFSLLMRRLVIPLVRHYENNWSFRWYELGKYRWLLSSDQ